MSRARDFANLAGSAAAGGLSGRNMIINGAMQVAQRGTSASAASGYTVMDRFRNGSMGTLDNLAVTKSQSTTAPDGFSNSLKFVATTAESTVAANERFMLNHRIEAQNLQHLKFGTSDAKTTTLSFWVRSNVTGDYGCSLYQSDGNRIIGDTYTISNADTWEHKSITFVGDTGGTINNDTGIGFEIIWHLLAGTDYTDTDNSSWATYDAGMEAYGHTADWGETTNDEWYITGVQLEVGTTATPFEHKSYGEELALCRRYYCQSGAHGVADNPWTAGVTTNANYNWMQTDQMNSNSDRHPVSWMWPTPMRTSPTMTYYPARTAIANTASRINPYSSNTLVTFTGTPAARPERLAGYFSGTSTDANSMTFNYTADAEL